MSPNTTVVADHANWLYAVTSETEPRRLLVSASVRLRSDNVMRQPVKAILDGKCKKVIKHSTVAAPMMMGGEANVREYHIWADCPGSAVPHECAVPISQSVSGVQSMPVPVVPAPRKACMGETGCLVPSWNSSSLSG